MVTASARQAEGMSSYLPHPFRPGARRAPWAAPLAGLLVVGTAVAVPMVASASPKLPDRTAAQLLVDISKADGTALSGTVVETARLGLPALPEVGGSAITPTSLLSGSHTAHVWYDGKHKSRVALVGSLAETDLVHNGRDVWLWTSGANTAQHATMPAPKTGDTAAAGASNGGDATDGAAAGVALTPAQAAAKALAAIDPTTTVVVDGTAKVAGRPAYELVLTPKDTRSLVGDVRLAIDSKTGVPLRVQIHARGATASRPAFETAFESVTFAAPDAAVFRFTPPAGAKVSELGSAMGGSGSPSRAGASKDSSTKDNSTKDNSAKDSSTRDSSAKPTVVGTGWTSVLVMSGLTDLAGPGASSGKDSGSTSALVSTLQRAMTPVSGAFGSGQLLRTKLVSVLLTSDGKLLVGAVTPATLEQAAAG